MKNAKQIFLGLLVVGLAGAAQAAPANWQYYTNPKLGYSISFPPRWTVDTNHVSASIGPDYPIRGVGFRIPSSLARGTNLGSDNTQIAVESLPGKNCKPSQFVDPAENVHTVKADGRTYSSATSEDAGAGNHYETLLFVIDGTSPCIAVRYFIHSSAFENYDPGTIKKFDRNALIKLFEGIRATLTLKPKACLSGVPRAAARQSPPRK